MGSIRLAALHASGYYITLPSSLIEHFELSKCANLHANYPKSCMTHPQRL